MEPAARRLLGPRQGRAEHDRVGAAGHRPRDIATDRDAAVGDDRHVGPGAAGEPVAGPRAAATSQIAVACGTPMPRTLRLVHAAPGPTPTNTAAAPASSSPSAA